MHSFLLPFPLSHYWAIWGWRERNLRQWLVLRNLFRTSVLCFFFFSFDFDFDFIYLFVYLFIFCAGVDIFWFLLQNWWQYITQIKEQLLGNLLFSWFASGLENFFKIFDFILIYSPPVICFEYGLQLHFVWFFCRLHVMLFHLPVISCQLSLLHIFLHVSGTF